MVEFSDVVLKKKGVELKPGTVFDLESVVLADSSQFFPIVDGIGVNVGLCRNFRVNEGDLIADVEIFSGKDGQQLDHKNLSIMLIIRKVDSDSDPRRITVVTPKQVIADGNLLLNPPKRKRTAKHRSA